MAAVAREKFTRAAENYTGQISIHGEIWNARSARPVAAGDELVVQGREGLTLEVAPCAKAAGHPQTGPGDYSQT